jgi:putative Holliday junction resolvase
MATYLGFDFGIRKIGIAVGQTVTQSATPLCTLRYRQEKPDWQGIGKLIREWQPQGLVVGLPFELDDREADIAPLARRFARQLHGRYHLPVYHADERLTSRQAEQDIGHRIANIEQLDAYAAKLILETWLSEGHDAL